MRILEISKSIKYKYKDFIQPINYLEKISNIYDEVYFHSNVIYNLLKSKEYQKEFLKILDFYDESYESYYNVFREYEHIDILLKNSSNAIIIENKIYANDQDKQLERYYNTLREEKYKKNDIQIVYLTLNGQDPSEDSIGILNIDRIISISYAYHINKWLNQCKIRSIDSTIEREFISMYKSIVIKITKGGGLSMEEQELVPMIIENYENYKAAILITSSIIEAKKYIQSRFWKILKLKLEKFKYKIIENNANDDAIDKYYNTSKNRFWYGISLKLKNGLIFRIEIERHLYFGIKKNDSKNIDINYKVIFPSYKSSQSWICYRYSNEIDFDFLVLDSDKIESFFTEEKTLEIIDKFIIEIQKDISEFEKYT